MPYLISVSNRGEDTAGVVRIDGSGFTMEYPVALPRGASKRLVAYAPASALQFDMATITLETSVGTVQLQTSPKMDLTCQRAVLLIGGNPGLLSFVRLARKTSNGNWRDAPNAIGDCYGAPGSLPERAYGYTGISLIVMGEGSERMRDAEVVALRNWVVGGGTMLFTGGASSPVLADARWRDFVPVRNLRLQNVSTVPGFEAYQPGKAQTITIQAGEKETSAEAAMGSGMVSRRIGLGKVFYLAFNPFEPPVRMWHKRREMLHRILYLVGEPTQWSKLGLGILPQEAMGNPYGGAQPEADSPFSAKLPSTGTVALILLSYLLVVVPVNFLVLRKLRLGERAWVSAPLISLLFAGAIFAMAGGLYRHGLSASVRGLLIVSPEMSDGYFFGKSRMFFPRGGEYNLGMGGVESIESNNPFVLEDDPLTYYRGRTQSTFERLNAYDVGEIQVPRLAATNLNFREFFFRQRLPFSERFRCNLSVGGGKRVTISGTIYNDSHYPVSDAFVYAGKYGVGGLSIPAHGKAQLKNVKAATAATFPGAFWPGPHQFALYGKLDGFRPGPQIGTLVKEQGGQAILCFMENGGRP